MATMETRVKDFTAFIDDSGFDATENYYYHDGMNWKSDDRNWQDPGFKQTELHPVVGISWRDAVAFCVWLTETERRNNTINTRQTYRLPTEREWSLAAGIDPTPIPELYGNFHPLLNLDPFEHTSPVGSFVPNENGFYDMAGNVWEFCLDTFDSRDLMFVIRGGSWQNWHARFIGVHSRGRCSPDIRISIYGFRIVLAPVDEKLGEMLKKAKTTVPPESPMSDEIVPN